MKPLTDEQQADVQKWRREIAGLSRFPDEYLYSLQRRYMAERCGGQAASPWGATSHVALVLEFATKLLEWGVVRNVVCSWSVNTMWNFNEPVEHRFNPRLEVR